MKNYKEVVKEAFCASDFATQKRENHNLCGLWS